jgi:acyl dehydratase
MKIFSSLSEFTAAAGEELGTSDWHQITQEQVNTFAEATGDFQWIHVDVERAKAGPFGGPIAHGFLTLSLFPVLLTQIYRVDNLTMGVNYGIDNVRFPHPVPVGGRVREHAKLLAADPGNGTVRVRIGISIEIEGVDKPGAVGELILVLAGS